MFIRDNILKIMYNHKIMDNYGGITSQLDWNLKIITVTYNTYIYIYIYFNRLYKGIHKSFLIIDGRKDTT